VLGVGIDWAETFHLVALGRPGEGVVQVLRVEHSKPALEALLEQLRDLEPTQARSGSSWRPATGCWWNACSRPGSWSCRSTLT
jgi:hypothetical protein